MKANWTTAKGSNIEIEINHTNGLRAAGIITINGTQQHTAKIEKVSGTWCARFDNVCVPLPANVFAAIETDREASKPNREHTAEELAKIAHDDAVWAAKLEMEKWINIDNVQYIKARDVYFNLIGIK